MRKYVVNDCIIKKLDSNLFECYKAKYIITYNRDIVDFANTKKDAIKIAKNWKIDG